MYSYEDRIRAVKLYIKLGKRVKATFRHLGYPTKNALKDWWREYERHLDLRSRYAAKTPKYSEAQKLAAVKHYRTHDRCIAATIVGILLPWSWNIDGVGSRSLSRGQNGHDRSIVASSLSRGVETGWCRRALQSRGKRLGCGRRMPADVVQLEKPVTRS